MSDCDAIIVGGGPAGSAAAILLARQKQNVLLIEKETVPHHKVCGEFISAEAQAFLKTLGLDLLDLGAVPIHRMRLIHKRKSVAIDLPFQALSLSRFALDEALLQQASLSGAAIRRGSTATHLDRNQNNWRVSVASAQNKQAISSDTVFLSSGKHDLRGWPRAPGLQNNLIGLKMYFEMTSPVFSDCVDVVLFDGGYAGIEAVEGNRVNVCLVISKEEFAQHDKNWDSLLQFLLNTTPLLAERLKNAVPCWPKPLSIYGIPYGFISNTKDAPGLFRVGDQMAVIPSFCGNGLSIALHTAFLAAQNNRDTYDIAAHKAWRRKVRSAARLSQLSIQPFLQPWLVHACRAYPKLLTAVAIGTRL